MHIPPVAVSVTVVVVVDVVMVVVVHAPHLPGQNATTPLASHE